MLPALDTIHTGVLPVPQYCSFYLNVPKLPRLRRQRSHDSCHWHCFPGPCALRSRASTGGSKLDSCDDLPALFAAVLFMPRTPSCQPCTNNKRGKRPGFLRCWRGSSPRLKGGDTLFKEIILDVCDVGVWQNGGVQENAACSPLTTGTAEKGHKPHYHTGEAGNRLPHSDARQRQKGDRGGSCGENDSPYPPLV